MTQEELMAQEIERLNIAKQYGAQFPSKTAPQAQQQPQEQQGLLARIGAGFQNLRNDPEKMARLQMGLNSMRLNPDQGIAASAAQTIQTAQEDRRLQSRANASIAHLQRKAIEEGANGNAAKALAAIQASPDDYSAILKAYFTAELKGRTKYESMSGKQLNERFPGSNYEPTKMYRVETSDDQEGVKVSQIGSGFEINMPKLTESQSNAATFFNRAQGANAILNELEAEGTDLQQALLGKIPIVGNMAVQPAYRRFDAAKQDFISAVLRKESGAAISSDEFIREDKKYFPQPGDDKQVIQDKRAARQRAIQGLKVGAGEGAGLIIDAAGSAPAGLPAGVTVTKD